MYLTFWYLLAVHNGRQQLHSLFLVKGLDIRVTAWVFLKASKIPIN